MSSQASVGYGATAPFGPGVPALNLFPVKLWNKYCLDALNDDERNNLSYGQINGSAALRTSIANHLSDTRSVKVDPEQNVLTSGAQQAFVLIAFVLLNKQDTVWYEDAGPIAGRDILQLMGANVVPVPIDSEGIDLDFAEQTHPGLPSFLPPHPINNHWEPL